MSAVTTLHGTLEAALHVEGTALAPRVELKARAFDLTGSSAPTPTRVNVDVLGRYQGNDGNVVVTVARPEGFVADVTATTNLPIAVILAAGAGRPAGRRTSTGTSRSCRSTPCPAWHRAASARRGLRRHRPPRAAPRTAGGRRPHGRRSSRRAHTVPKSATLSAHTQGNALRATARIEQDDGFAEGRVQAELGWEDGLTPRSTPGTRCRRPCRRRACRSPRRSRSSKTR